MENSNKLKFLGFAGSLRVGSYNKALLRATIDLLPQNVYLEIFEIDGIPLFNQDIEKDMPTKVREFKSKIREADAILIATPEYNYSMPAQLAKIKHDIDETRATGRIKDEHYADLKKEISLLCEQNYEKLIDTFDSPRNQSQAEQLKRIRDLISHLYSMEMINELHNTILNQKLTL